LDVKILLDTNAYSALSAGHPAIEAKFRQAKEVVLSAVMLGELLYGFRHGSRYEKNRKKLDEFLSYPQVRWLPVTLQTAERFGQIAADLRRKGRPIPTNDIWIAAQALELGAELVSLDPHFAHIEELGWQIPAGA
jgi:tRNA(fMet)-specific endonuclease VapC